MLLTGSLSLIGHHFLDRISLTLRLTLSLIHVGTLVVLRRHLLKLLVVIRVVILERIRILELLLDRYGVTGDSPRRLHSLNLCLTSC